jgi:hypothetical protein
MGIIFDLIQPNGAQMQNLVDKPVGHEPLFREQAAKIAPVVTVQTISSTKAALPGTPLASRNQMIIRNLDPVRTLRIGTESTVTAKVGRLIEPLEELTLLFDKATAVAVWAVATGAELKVEVIES